MADSKAFYAVPYKQPRLTTEYHPQRICWPFYYWQAIVPENVAKDGPNLFESLYQSLVELDPPQDPKTVFRELGIADDVYDHVKKACEANAFAPQRPAGYSETYLFRDAVTGCLIPDLTLQTLPGERRFEPKDGVLPPFPKDSRARRAPDVLELEDLVRRFRRNLDFLAESPEDDPRLCSSAHDFALAALEEADEEAAAAEATEEAGEAEEDAQVEADHRRRHPQHGAGAVQVSDRFPEELNLVLYLYEDPADPGVFHLETPFPNVPRHFFDRLLAAAEDVPALQKALDDYRVQLEIEKEDEAKTAAWKAAPHADILSAYPSVFQHRDFHPIQTEIDRLTQAYHGLTERHESLLYGTVFETCGKVFEVLLQRVMMTVPKPAGSAASKAIEHGDFPTQMERVLKDLGQADAHHFVSRLASKSQSAGVARYLCRKDMSYPKHGIIAYAFYVWLKKLPNVQIFQAHPTLVRDVFDLYDLRNRNAHHQEKEVERTEEQQEDEARDAYERVMAICDLFVGGCLQPFLKAKRAGRPQKNKKK